MWPFYHINTKNKRIFAHQYFYSYALLNLDMALLFIRFYYYRISDHLSGISNADRNFYPSPVTFQEPSNCFISSFFPKLHRSSYYRAHAQRKLLYRGGRLLALHPHTHGNIDIEKIYGLQHYLQPKQQLNVSSAGYDIDNNDNDDNGEEDTTQIECQDSVSLVDCTDQSVPICSPYMWEVDHTSSNVALPIPIDESKQQSSSLRMAMKKLATLQRRRYTFPTNSVDKRQESPKQFEITGIHYTTLVSPMGTVPRLPKSSGDAKRLALAKRRSKQDKRSPVLHQMINMSGNRSASDRASKSPYTETSKHIFPFKNEAEPLKQAASNNENSEGSDSQQRDVSLHNNCINRTRRRVLHKYLATRLQRSSHFDRLSKQNQKLEHSVKLGIIMPSKKESLQATQNGSQ